MSLLASCQEDARSLPGHRGPATLGCGVVTHDDAGCGRASSAQGSPMARSMRGRVQAGVRTPRGLRGDGANRMAARGRPASVKGDPRQHGGSQGNCSTISGPGLPRGVGKLCPPIGPPLASLASALAETAREPFGLVGLVR